ncbi:hypothetical protein GALL_148780 [mine drainage metagenome]|uniref:Uncharacterized protein n=1 Tax=mine drainage metagenome TaxID=410659 RepID=A0A1J5SN57_9ZZZZ
MASGNQVLRTLREPNLANRFDWLVLTIAGIYRKCWQIENSFRLRKPELVKRLPIRDRIVMTALSTIKSNRIGTWQVDIVS